MLAGHGHHRVHIDRFTRDMSYHNSFGPFGNRSFDLLCSNVVALAVGVSGDAARCEALRQSLCAADLDLDLANELASLLDVPFAVRSSATVEDGGQGSYSCLFKTRLGVVKADLGEAVKEVWASVFAPSVVAYHRQVAADAPCPPMAVLIMPLLDARLSGVAFSADPADGNPFRIVVNACLGLGARLVDGSERGTRYVLDFDRLDVVEVHPGVQRKGDFLQEDGRVATRDLNREVALSEGELRHLGEAVRSIDAVLGKRVDVEFAFAGEGLFILQAREILGLPPFFPDDPVASGQMHGPCHSTRTDPLPARPGGAALDLAGSRPAAVRGRGRSVCG